MAGWRQVGIQENLTAIDVLGYHSIDICKNQQKTKMLHAGDTVMVSTETNLQ